MLISVCIIVRNEEKQIGQALMSIPVSYEKIVVDTGSTDQTVNIALFHGAKVSQYPWNDDFAAARNASVAKASGDYILILDADEELAEDTEQTINKFIQQHPHSAGAVIIHNVIGEEINKHRMLRFFPNDSSFYFHGIVHETVYYNGEHAIFEDTKITIHHLGYQIDQYTEKDKPQRYLQLYSNYLNSNPNDGYMLYQLGKLYYSINEYQQACEVLYRCVERKEHNFLYYPVMLVILGYTLKHMGKSQEAEKMLTSYLTQYPDFPDMPFLLGLLCMDTGNIRSIETYFLSALSIGETDKYSSAVGVGSFKAAYNLGVYYEIIGIKSKALHFYRVSAATGYRPAQERLLKN